MLSLGSPERVHSDPMLAFLALLFIFAEEERPSGFALIGGILFIGEAVDLEEGERIMQSFEQSDNHSLD